MPILFLINLKSTKPIGKILEYFLFIAVMRPVIKIFRFFTHFINFSNILLNQSCEFATFKNCFSDVQTLKKCLNLVVFFLHIFV